MGCKELDIRDYYRFAEPSEKSHSRAQSCTEKPPYNGFSHTVISNYRYYSPELGRWLSRDPIEEEGGENLYGMVDNDLVDWWDFLGYKIPHVKKKDKLVGQEDREEMMKIFEDQWHQPVLYRVSASCKCKDINFDLSPFLRDVNDVLKAAYEARKQSWLRIRRYFLKKTFIRAYRTKNKRVIKEINKKINKMFREEYTIVNRLYLRKYKAVKRQLDLVIAHAKRCGYKCTKVAVEKVEE